MSSGLELIEAIEVTVFRRPWEAGAGGAETESLFADVLLESHEKLMPNFLAGGGGCEGVAVGFPAGGGPQGIDGRLPDRPCERKGNLGGDAVMS